MAWLSLLGVGVVLWLLWVVDATTTIPLAAIEVVEVVPGVPPATWLNLAASRLATYDARCSYAYGGPDFDPGCALAPPGEGPSVRFNVTSSHNLAFIALFNASYLEALGLDYLNEPVPGLDMSLNLTRFRVEAQDHDRWQASGPPFTLHAVASLVDQLGVMALGAPAGYGGVVYLLHTTDTAHLARMLTLDPGETTAGLLLSPGSAQDYGAAKHYVLPGDLRAPVFAPFFEFTLTPRTSDSDSSTLVMIIVGILVGLLALAAVVVLVGYLCGNRLLLNSLRSRSRAGFTDMDVETERK